MLQGKFDSALYHLKIAADQGKNDTEIYLQSGICQFNLNNYNAAREAFYEAEKRRRGLGSLYLAKTEIRLNHPELGIKYLREHLSSTYKLPEQEILLDQDLSTLEGTPGWQQLWNEKSWYSQEEKDFQEARFLREHGDRLEAINLLNRLEKQGFEPSRVQAEKAAVYTELGNDRAAGSALQSAVQSDVRNLDAQFRLAEYQIKEGDLEKALAGLDRVLRQAPDRFEAYLLRGRARSDYGDLPGALDDINLYLLYFPSNHEAYYQRGLIQHSNGRYLDAIQSFNRALQMEQGRADYFFARGRTYAATGTIRYADRDMSMALDLDPLNGELWFEKGNLSEELGDSNTACHCFRKAFQYGVYEAGERVEKNCQ
jgi:tetratricopeptide (TPR) repeat protein